MLSPGLEYSDRRGIELRASPRLHPRYPAMSDTSGGQGSVRAPAAGRAPASP